jgi:MFS family permease
MAGPALGGLFIAMFKGTWQVYLFAALTSTIYVFMLASIRQRSSTASVSADAVAKELDLRSLVAGFGYVRRNTVLLAAMTLDLFAVLLGGAVALLPIFAKDILRVGPVGLGWLQAAPSLGAILMALTTTHLPPMKKAGKTLLWAVAGFGIATVVFGISRSFWLSMLMLFLTGAFDNISVVIRHTLVQVLTPDEMRGRVSAVNGMFINASNELGRFESGVLAAFTGPIAAVVIGGAGTLAVVAFSALKWPELRRVGMLDSDTIVK